MSRAVELPPHGYPASHRRVPLPRFQYEDKPTGEGVNCRRVVYGTCGGGDADSRRIAHLDMNAFFASVKVLRYPERTGNRS
jgi:hypothetical protein